METFFEFFKEILKGVVRAISAYYFQKVLRKQKKTPAVAMQGFLFSNPHI